MKDYQTVCADLIVMLKDLEQSLNDITLTAQSLESQSEENQMLSVDSMIDFILKKQQD